MTLVRFASICDIPGCGARSEEYSSWPVCGECNRDICPVHQVPGTLEQDEGVNRALCHDCKEGVHPLTDTPQIDLSQVPDRDIRAEFIRRIRPPTGANKKLAPCTGCGEMLGAHERRKPCPKCGTRNAKQMWSDTRTYTT